MHYTYQTRYVDSILVECRYIVCDVGPTLNQYYVNVSCLFAGIYDLLLIVSIQKVIVIDFDLKLHTRQPHSANVIRNIIMYIPPNSRLWSNAVLILDHHLRHWPNIKSALGIYLVFSVCLSTYLTLWWYLPNYLIDIVYRDPQLQVGENYSFLFNLTISQNVMFKTYLITHTLIGLSAKFPPTWSCVSLPRPTTSSGWKLLTFV